MWVVKCADDESYNAVISGLLEVQVKYSALTKQRTIIVTERNSTANRFIEGLQVAKIPTIEVITA